MPTIPSRSPAGRVPVLLVLSACLPAFAPTPCEADVVELEPSRDATIYSEMTDGANGAGTTGFAGFNRRGDERRLLLGFDVAGSVPSGSTVTSVQLDVSVNKARAPMVVLELHALLADWSEGSTANAPGGPDCGDGGNGMPVEASAGDVTWAQRVVPDQDWAAAGGELAAMPSASAMAGGCGVVTWSSTAELVADVQSWVDDPASSFGWIVVEPSGTDQGVKRIETRETTGQAPLLTVEFDPPVGMPDPAGAVPDGVMVPGDPLRVRKGAADTLRITWSPSCEPMDVTHVVLAGEIGDFASHVPLTPCPGIMATELELAPGEVGSAAYFLVVPQGAEREGSPGFDSTGARRPQGPMPCQERLVADCG